MAAGINVPALKTEVVALKWLAATGYLVGLKLQSRVKVTLPADVADSPENLPPISHEGFWTLADQNRDEQEVGGHAEGELRPEPRSEQRT